ncbi:MAG TPA: hypothetical protein VHF47_09695 [Acidimicrobiales bacterium]|nr:hypothetical protein [Acidimicrobiales bacterium]
MAPLLYPVGVPLLTTAGNATSVSLNDEHVVTSFVFDIATATAAACSVGTLFGTGVVVGYCGHAMGFGVDNAGHSFSFVSAGGLVAITGRLTGTAVLVPNAAVNTCLHGGAVGPPLAGAGATDFIVLAGVVARSNCIAEALTVHVVDIPGQHQLTGHVVLTGTLHFFHVTSPSIKVHTAWHVCAPVKL